MGIESAVMLERLSAILRHQIGPAVDDEFARTQAFMASVILGKLAVELTAEDHDPTAEPADAALARQVRGIVAAPPPRLAAAIDLLAIDGATATWNELVAAVHEAGPALAPQEFEEALRVVRAALRARLDDALRAAR